MIGVATVTCMAVLVAGIWAIFKAARLNQAFMLKRKMDQAKRENWAPDVNLRLVSGALVKGLPVVVSPTAKDGTAYLSKGEIIVSAKTAQLIREQARPELDRLNKSKPLLQRWRGLFVTLAQDATKPFRRY